MGKRISVVCTVIGTVLVILFIGWKRTADTPYMVQEKNEYGYSLEEIGNRLEYIYQLENTLGLPAKRDFGELGNLPPEEDVNIQIYLVKGNRILFLPESRANMKVEMDGSPYNVYYSSNREGYLFYCINDWGEYEAGVPVNSPESSYIMYCMAADERNTDKVNECSKKGIDVYDMGELSYLGEIQVDLRVRMLSELDPIEVVDNVYINGVVEYVSETLAREGEYGDYTIYLNQMHRIQYDKSGSGWTHCYMDCVIEGNGRMEYAEFMVYDGYDIDGRVFPLSGPRLADSLGYFSDYYSEEENQERIEKIINHQRGVVKLEITERTEGLIKEPQQDNGPDYNMDIDFCTMPVGEIARRLSYVCSYSEWFGMAELGARIGAAGRFNGQEVILYPWDYGRGLLFIPADKVNTYLYGAGGKLCPVYVNEMGYMEFYQLDRNAFVDGSGQLDTSMITIREYEMRLSEYLVKMDGKVNIMIEELTELEMPSVKEDRFICAYIQQVEKLLAQEGMKGTYTVQIGEYESVCANKACISAAVTQGKDEYYIRYLIVGYGDGQYYFWPAGFGTDGSLKECAGTSYNMNQTCIDHTKLLNRTAIEIVLR